MLVCWFLVPADCFVRKKLSVCPFFFWRHPVQKAGVWRVEGRQTSGRRFSTPKRGRFLPPVGFPTPHVAFLSRPLSPVDARLCCCPVFAYHPRAERVHELATLVYVWEGEGGGGTAGFTCRAVSSPDLPIPAVLPEFVVSFYHSSIKNLGVLSVSFVSAYSACSGTLSFHPILRIIGRV